MKRYISATKITSLIRSSALLLLFLQAGIACDGTDHKRPLKRYYATFGFSPLSNIPNNQKQSLLFPYLTGPVGSGLIIETNKSFILGIRFNKSTYKDHSHAYKDGIWEDEFASHSSRETALIFGKNFDLNRTLSITFSGGAAYVKYTRPENIHQVPNPHSWDIFQTYPSDWNDHTYELLGISARVDFNINSAYCGICTGLFVNYNKMNPAYGIQTSISFGKLRASSKAAIKKD